MLTHIYDFVFASLCAYIKRPLTAIGGSGGAAGVFALAAIQHSTFLCDIQYCDLRKPTLQRSLLSLSLTFPLSLQPLSSSCHLPNSLCFCPFRPLSLYHSALFSYLSLGNHVSPPPPQNPHFIFPPWVSKTFSTTLLTEVPWRGTFLSTPSLNTHLVAIMKKSQHCPGHLMYHSDAYFSFIRNSLCIHSTAIWTGVTPSISFPPLNSKPLNSTSRLFVCITKKTPNWLENCICAILSWDWLFFWSPFLSQTFFCAYRMSQQTPPLTPPSFLLDMPTCPETFHLRWPYARGKAVPPPSLHASLLPLPLSLGCKLLDILKTHGHHTCHHKVTGWDKDKEEMEVCWAIYSKEIPLSTGYRGTKSPSS